MSHNVLLAILHQLELVVLLNSQRLDRVQSRGTPRRNHAGNARHQHQHHADQQQHSGVERPGFIQHRANQTHRGYAAGKTEDKPSEGGFQAIGQHQPQHQVSLCAKRVRIPICAQRCAPYTRARRRCPRPPAPVRSQQRNPAW